MKLFSKSEWPGFWLKSIYESGRNRSKSASYPLTADQRTQLLYPSQRTTQQAAAIREKKASRLHFRIAEILEDSAIFRSAGVFSDGLDEWDNWDWEEHWNELVNVQRHTRRVDPNFVTGPFIGIPDSYYRDLGIEVGKMFRFMMEPVEDSSPLWFLFGILLGLRADYPESETSDAKVQEIKRLKNDLGFLSEWLDVWGAHVTGYKNKVVGKWDRIDAFTRIVDECIADFQITPSNPLRTYLISNTDIANPLIPKVGNYWEEKKKDMKPHLQRLLSNSNIVEMERLADQIEEDIELLQEQKFNGKKAFPVFIKIYRAQQEMDGPVEPDFDLNRSQFVPIIDLLSGNKQDSEIWGEYRPEWGERPVLSKSYEGYELTGYGELIAFVLTSEYDLRDLLHRKAIPSKELDDDEAKLLRNALWGIKANEDSEDLADEGS